jgi:hypothetical protein
MVRLITFVRKKSPSGNKTEARREEWLKSILE